MTTPSAPSVALRYAAARVAAVKIPDPYNMTKAEFLNPSPPKARSGYQLLYHVTSNDAAKDIARNGLLTRYSKSPPKGTIWASTKPDDFYGSRGSSALITFQVPKRGTPADQDPHNRVVWDMGNSVVIARDITPEDIVDIDLYYETDLGSRRLSWFRGGSRYAETYWDEWFGPRQKGKTASRIDAPPAMLKEITEWVWSLMASEILRNVERVRGHRKNPIRWQRTVDLLGEDEAWGTLVDLAETERLAKKYGGKMPSGSLPKAYTKDFPVDLRGWKHERYVKDLLDAGKGSPLASIFMGHPITVQWVTSPTHAPSRVRGPGGSTPKGTWDAIGLLRLFMSAPSGGNPRMIKRQMNEVARVIRHELQHLAQTVLENATNIDTAGLPAGGERGRVSPHSTTEDEHALRDVEFYTRLQDDIDEFLRLREKFGSAGDDRVTRKAIGVWVGEEPAQDVGMWSLRPSRFFTELRKHDRRKYRKAVGEFWAAVSEGGTPSYRFASGYGEGHMPSDEGPPAHDLLEDGEGFAPPDILDNPHYYTAFKSQLRSFWPTILKSQGKPGARIKVYRALPSQYDEFNRGDWVTLSYEYAKDHADRGNVSGDDAHVIEATVPASTVRWDGDDLMEWGYFGPTVTGKSRTASTRKNAARPIRLPTREIKTLAKRLAQRLYQYGLPKPGRVIAQEYLPLTNVMGDEVVVEVLLTGTPGRNRDPFSNELLNGGFLKRRPEGPLIRVFVNPHLDPRSFEVRPRRIVEDELYRLLAHELTHAADVWHGKGSVGDPSASKDDFKKHHHNHPAEVKALMRDVVSNLDDGDTVREFMDYGMDFNTALREALKDTKWPDIEPYLSPKNKKTILKGVYTFLQDQGLDEVAR